MTGQSLGDDVGYGPARLHNPDETRQFARFLSAQNVEHLKRRVNYREMLGLQVYAMPSGGQTPDAQHEAELRQEVGSIFLSCETTLSEWPASRTVF
jgi:hypothetical protein